MIELFFYKSIINKIIVYKLTINIIIIFYFDIVIVKKIKYIQIFSIFIFIYYLWLFFNLSPKISLQDNKIYMSQQIVTR